MTPGTWSSKPLKRVAPIQVKRVDAAPQDARYVALENIEPWTGRLLANATFEGTDGGVLRFEEGDVLFGKLRPYLAKVARPNFAGFASAELVVLRPQQVLSEFLQYYLLTPQVVSEVNSWTFGTKMPRVTSATLGGIEVPVPSIKEQQAIVRFLNHQIPKIDVLIDANRRLLRATQCYRQVVTTSLVTSGRFSISVKPSGVDWIGDIPVDWGIRRLKTLAKLESGHTPKRSEPTYWVDCETPWVSLNDVGRMKDARYLQETTHKINKKGLENSSARLLPARTVILSRDATVGRTAILAEPMATSQHFVNWICEEDALDPEYLYFLFNDAMQDEFNRLTMGSTLRTIGLPDVNSFTIPVPPLEEQRAIADRCVEVEESGRLAYAFITRMVSLLREYRSALITAAVTGQIDVRSAA